MYLDERRNDNGMARTSAQVHKWRWRRWLDMAEEIEQTCTNGRLGDPDSQ